MFNTRFITFSGFFLFLCYNLAFCALKVCPPNENYKACGPACESECATLNQPCLKLYIRCPDGCYCNQGYARDANDVCIPKANCPKLYLPDTWLTQ